MDGRRLVSLLLFAAAPIACAAQTMPIADSGDDDDTEAPAPAPKKTTPANVPTGSTPTGSADSCTGRKFATPDLSTLKACKAGGHCWPKAKLFSLMASGLTACDDPNDACVPDEILKAGGTKLKSCTQPDAVKAATGEGGGCVNLALFPDAQAQAAQYLQQRECDAGQTCMPCMNPLNQQKTGFCEEIGVFDAPCSGGETDAGTPPPPPACCTTNGKSNGVCMSATVLPADKQDAMPKDTCASGNVCMPTAFFGGTPTSCNAGLLLGKGICMDVCFNDMLSLAGSLGILTGKGCGSTELCAPCSILKSQMPKGIALPGCE